MTQRKRIGLVASSGPRIATMIYHLGACGALIPKISLLLGDVWMVISMLSLQAYGIHLCIILSDYNVETLLCAEACYALIRTTLPDLPVSCILSWEEYK